MNEMTRYGDFGVLSTKGWFGKNEQKGDVPFCVMYQRVAFDQIRL